MKRLLLSTTLGVLASFGVNAFSMSKEEADIVYAQRKAQERAAEQALRTVAAHEFENGFAYELPDTPQSPPENPKDVKAAADGQQAAPKASAAGAAGAGAAATQPKKELRKESPYTEAL